MGVVVLCWSPEEEEGGSSSAGEGRRLRVCSRSVVKRGGRSAMVLFLGDGGGEVVGMDEVGIGLGCRKVGRGDEVSVLVRRVRVALRVSQKCRYTYAGAGS
jgi:hypothetical protein